MLVPFWETRRERASKRFCGYRLDNRGLDSLDTMVLRAYILKFEEVIRHSGRVSPHPHRFLHHFITIFSDCAILIVR